MADHGEGWEETPAWQTTEYRRNFDASAAVDKFKVVD